MVASLPEPRCSSHHRTLSYETSILMCCNLAPRGLDATFVVKSRRSSMTERRERQAQGGFATRLRSVVEAHGSANGIAKAIARSEGAVRKWLRGESEPNVTDLRALSEVTQTRIEWLVTGEGPRQLQPESDPGSAVR